MKILFVSPQVPHPLNVGSKIRIYNLLKSYSYKHEVTLITFTRDAEDAENLSNLEKMCKKIYGVPLDTYRMSNQRRRKTVRIFQRFMSLTPYPIESFVCPEMRQRIDEEIDSGAYDAIHVAKTFVTPNVRVVRKRDGKGKSMVALLDVDDIDSRKALRLARVAPSSKERLLGYVDSIKLHLYESKVYSRYDCCFVCSENDKGILEARGLPTSIEVIPNGVDLDDRHADPTIPTCENTILFLGSMSYEPNEDAVLYFLASIFPLIKERAKDVRVIIAGKDPSEAVRRLHNGKDIFVTGYVSDVRDAYAQSTILAVPIRVGGGTRIKILEAMSLNVPVVSTSIGCEGIEVTDGRDILVADTPEHFAARCAELLSDRQKREMLACNAKTLVAQKYGWKGIGEKLNGILEAQFREKNGIPSGGLRAASRRNDEPTR